MYIDPNTGGMLAGILLSVFGVISATLFVFAGKIKMFFARLRRKSDEPVETQIDDSDRD